MKHVTIKDAYDFASGEPTPKKEVIMQIAEYWEHEFYSASFDVKGIIVAALLDLSKCIEPKWDKMVEIKGQFDKLRDALQPIVR